MRNLKKLLALVLAMMMALSLMVTANATTNGTVFSDDYQITEEFVEAAEVLTGMKIFQGDNGSFRPASQITRGEMAALIYRLATGDTGTTKIDLYATTTPFTDVQSADWFAGYVGYCWNAGYIKGRNETNTIFDPYGNVTGYEALAMVLRAMGYDQNGEFSGVSWTQRVASISQQRGLLDDIKSTNYANTLHMASRRDVVASILFQAAQKDRVTYTPAYGYQTGDHLTSSGANNGRYTDYTPLGRLNFDLAWTRGNVLGNQMTGESKTILSSTASAINNWGIDGDPNRYGTPNSTTPGNNHYDLTGGTNNPNKTLNLNLNTGLDMIGHKMKVWYKNDTASNKAVYAYYDEATLTDVVKADNTNLKDASGVGSIINLRDAATSAGFSIASNNRAVFNNSFGRFGAPYHYWNSTADAAGTTGNGTATNGSIAKGGTLATNSSTDNGTGYDEGYVSPVDLYLLISNGGKTLNVVIALNVEVSKITETNNVNRVPTIGMPVENWADNAPKAAPTPQGDALASSSTGDGTFFVSDNNIKDPNVSVTDINDTTGVIAQAALLGNSTKTLGDYEFGIHITGTTNSGAGRDTISANEQTAIDVTGVKTADERGYFLLSKITSVAEGTVVAYNNTAGTVTLNDGTILERSKFYDTVVGTEKNKGVSGNNVPETALPQAWTQGVNGSSSDVWVEGYANVGYKFYLDYEGKYLGAERSSGSSFLYGTYQDYSQETSTSTFNYFITGVNLNGEVETKQVKRYWDGTSLTSASTVININGTDALGIPFRDTANGTGQINGLGEEQYRGFAISGDIADGINDDTGANRNEYLNNMARLGVKQANNTNTGRSTDFAKIDIGRDQITLGAVETNTNISNKYFTEGTKFILVDGYGTDTVKPEVYNGISELRGNSSQVTIQLTSGSCNVALTTGWTVKPADAMTYYTESPYTYAQSGNTAMKIDTIILPKEAVTWVGGSSLYYLGDPNPVLMNSFGQDAWKYGMYVDGERREVWLSNLPNTLTNDQFYQLKATDNVANDGQPIYEAGCYTIGTTTFVSGSVAGATYDSGWVDGQRSNWNGLNKTGAITRATYSATTQDAQTATFTFVDGGSELLRVAGAKVVNLNVSTSQGGYIWPGITDLTTLNQAGSIDPVTSRQLKVSAVYDPANPLVVTAIYVCWDQTV